MTKDSNGSMLDGIKQKSMTRISRLAGINRRDYGIEIKLKSGHGIKELFWGPQMNYCCVEKSSESRYHTVLNKKKSLVEFFLGSQVVSLTAVTFFTY